MEPNLDTHYFCLDHTLWYEQLIGICPKCETEICAEHDSHLEEKEDE